MGFRLEVFREGMRREGGKRESERLTLTRKQLRVLEMRVEKNSTLEPHDRKLGRELVPNIVWISDRCLVHNVSGSVIDVLCTTFMIL